MKQTQELDWRQLFKLNTVMLKSVGLWPPGDQLYGLNFYTLYSLASNGLFQAAFLFFQAINLYFTKDNLEELTGTIFILISEIGASLKSYCIFKNMKMLKILIVTVGHDRFRAKNSTQMNIVRSNIKILKAMITTFQVIAVGFLIFCSLFPILDGSVKEYRLPFLAWYPYDFRTSPNYEITYVFQILAINFLAVVNVNADSLIAGLNMFIGAQFDMLCADFKHFEEETLDASVVLKQYVKQHREILKFAYSINKFYNWLIFVQFFIGGISIGLAMFQLTVVTPFSTLFYTILFFVGAITTQVFMYCWFGNEIEQKSGKLLYAIFESDWISLSQQMRKDLFVFASSVQKPLKVSAFGLFYLSLDTFVKILRTAWSYFALLRQINSTN